MNPLEFFNRYAECCQPYKGGNWCYEDGLIYRGLSLLHKATGDQRFLDHLLRLANAQIAPDGALRGYDPDEYNIDNVMPGQCLFYLADVTGDPRYMAAADRLIGQLQTHPRTQSGNYWHKRIYPNQVWLDGLYMGLPFQIEYGRRAGSDMLVNDALDQLVRALELTGRGDGLYVHGYDEARQQAWADPETGHSAACWGRAMGWLAMALADVAMLSGREAFRVKGLEARSLDLFEKLLALKAQDGLWLQVIDQPDLPGNYSESSSSAMFAYAFLQAGSSGLWEKGIAEGQKALETVIKSALIPGGNGETALQRICHVAGLGGFSGAYRDGTPEYYLTEAVVADDPKGVGPLMMAVSACIMSGEKLLNAPEHLRMPA
ncbi:glycoside hydrolase family 88/105 protein [Roseibium litorale]|uniref:Glycoside hydrolase family 88 protein n=1 Tax=Roseibium litorale TaxID=2803841 RepID=A0ABR9CLI0_9HYPH|nr:glycoside hydrolase family 88 protein [Roseibium litorale]MBD8891177.1 glycoside hydrolase family 88 protein [Roseibium litorale]